MSGPVNTDIGKCPRILVLSRPNSINVVDSKRLLVVKVRKIGLQAINLVHPPKTYNHVRVYCAYERGKVEQKTHHGFHSDEVDDIISITVKNQGPDAGVYHVLQIRFARPHPVARGCKIVVDIVIAFLPGRLSTDG